MLADLADADVADSKQSFAERLGHWLDFTDAISLSATLNSGAAGGSAAQPSLGGGAVHEELARVRSALVNSISTDGVFRTGKVRIRLPTPAPGATIESAADFTPYRRYYLAHQRDMEASIGPLRANARAALSGLSPALGRLAALDGVLDEAMSVRERGLLSTVPGLLENRFARLRNAHRERLADAQAADDPERWMQPGGWLAVFCKDMQGVLLAELDVRLQPVMGLVEANGNEATGINE